ARKPFAVAARPAEEEQQQDRPEPDRRADHHHPPEARDLVRLVALRPHDVLVAAAAAGEKRKQLDERQPVRHPAKPRHSRRASPLSAGQNETQSPAAKPPTSAPYARCRTNVTSAVCRP